MYTLDVKDIRKIEYMINFMGLSTKIRYADDITARLMEDKSTGGSYIVPLDMIIYRPDNLTPAAVFHELGHAYDYYLDPNRDRDPLSSETEAFYLGYKLLRKFHNLEWEFAYLLDTCVEVFAGDFELYTRAANLALIRLREEGYIDKIGLDILREEIFSMPLEATLRL